MSQLTARIPANTYTQWQQFRIKHVYTRYRCEGYNNILAFPITPYAATYIEERGGVINPGSGTTTAADYLELPFGKRRSLQGGFRWTPKLIHYYDIGSGPAGANSIAFSRTTDWLFTDNFLPGGGPAATDVFFAGPGLLLPGMQNLGAPITNASVTAGYGIPLWKIDNTIVIEFRGAKGTPDAVSLSAKTWFTDHSIRENLEANIAKAMTGGMYFGKKDELKKK